jgi:hypothetical protein
MSFKQIREERRLAANLLSLISFFNLQGIPKSVLQTDRGNDDDNSEFNKDLNILRVYSLVKVTAESDVCEMH